METAYRSADIRIPEDAQDTRKVQFVISDDSKDRHRTVLNTNGWELENFNRNGVVGYQHDVYGGGMCKGPDPDSVIGKGRAWIEQGSVRSNGSESVLMGEVEFEPEEINPLAEKVFQKIMHGTLNATSVGFRAIGGGTLVNEETGQEKQMDEPPFQVPKGHTFHFEGQELLEFSVVNIPSNPNALKKDLRGQTANALQFIKRKLGEEWTYGEIEKLRVLDVIKMLERGEKPEKTFELDRELVKVNETVDKNEFKLHESHTEASNGLRKVQMRKIENRKQATLTKP